MQPMAARLGVDHQQLQQFLTSSTWDVAGVRRRAAQAAVQVVAPPTGVGKTTAGSRPRRPGTEHPTGVGKTIPRAA